MVAAPEMGDRLRKRAKAGIAVESGRLVVEPQQRRQYTLDELIAQCRRKAGRAKQRENGWRVSPWAVSSSDEERQDLNRQHYYNRSLYNRPLTVMARKLNRARKQADSLPGGCN